MSIDDELREILRESAGDWYHDGQIIDPSDDIENCLNAVKDAFKKTGYVFVPQGQVGKLDGVEIMSINGKEVMTGQEWYERFVSEIGKTDSIHSASPQGFAAVQVCMESARRASGIEESK